MDLIKKQFSDREIFSIEESELNTDFFVQYIIDWQRGEFYASAKDDQEAELIANTVMMNTYGKIDNFASIDKLRKYRVSRDGFEEVTNEAKN